MEARGFDDPYWREQGKVWVEVSPGRKRLVDLNKPRPTPNLCRSDFPAPAIISDYIGEVRSMANGKMYDSRSELFKTYKADGNPQGVDYECVGDTPVEEYSKPKARTREDEEAVDAAIARTLDEAGF